RSACRRSPRDVGRLCRRGRTEKRPGGCPDRAALSMRSTSFFLPTGKPRLVDLLLTHRTERFPLVKLEEARLLHHLYALARVPKRQRQGLPVAEVSQRDEIGSEATQPFRTPPVMPDCRGTQGRDLHRLSTQTGEVVEADAALLDESL